MDADDILQIDDKVQKEKNDIESTFESNEWRQMTKKDLAVEISS